MGLRFSLFAARALQRGWLVRGGCKELRFFAPRLHAKDLGNVLETSHALHAPLPLTAQLMEVMQGLMADGLGDADHGALIRHWEKLAGVEVRRKPA